MENHLRVHIIPLGYDSTRVTEPLIKKKADRVYFLRYTGDKSRSAYFNFIKSELSKKMKQLEVKEYFLNIWDLYECIEKFREIIQKENSENNHVFVNVSTGSKITAIAGMLSCMSWNASPYYVHVNYISEMDVTLQKPTVKGFDDLPVYSIAKPNPIHMMILHILKKNNGTIRKSKLIEELELLRIIKQKENVQTEFTIHAKYSQLHAILKSIESDWKFVEIRTSAKHSEIVLTEQGKKALRIFGVEND